MTGSGTQADPYIITTIAELYSMGDTGGASVYFKLGNDLDFDGTTFSTIPLKCAKFDGNGKMLRNIVYNNPSSTSSIFNVMRSSTTIFENLTVENLIITGSSVSFFSSAYAPTIEMTNCSFSGYVSYGTASTQSTAYKGLINDSNTIVKMELCTLALKIDYVTAVAVICRGYIKHSQLRLEITALNFASVATNADGLFSNTTVTDSYLFGSISKTNASGNTDDYLFSNSNTYFSNFYSVFTFGAGISTVHWKGTISTPCFYDSEVTFADHTVTFNVGTNPGNLFALTTAQAKDVSYLRSIGFNCEEGV